MHDDVARASGVRLSRTLLLAGGAAILWAAITLFAQASPSAAAEEDNGGLLGLVSSTVNTVTKTTSATVDAVDTTVKAAVKAVEPVTAPVVSVAPKPVQKVVTAVVKTATTTVSKTTEAADTIVRSAADETLTTVSNVVNGTPIVGDVLGDIVGTPTKLDPLLPVVDLDVVTSIVTGPVVVPDAPVAVDPGAPVLSVPAADVAVPASAVTAADDPLAVAWQAFAVTSAVAVPATVSAAEASADGILPVILSPLVPGDSSAPATAGGITLLFGAVAALAFTRPRLLAAVHRHGGPGDDALPGAPVFETDSSPD